MRVAVLDMDGTLLPGALGLRLAQHLAAAGAPIDVDRLEDVLERYRCGSVSHAEMTVEAQNVYLNGLAGLAVTVVDQAATAVWRQARGHLYAYVEPLLLTLRNAGFRVVLISGSPRETVALAARDLNVDTWAGATLKVQDGYLQKAVVQLPGMPGEKVRLLGSLLNGAQIDFPASIAIGDSLTDVEILELVGHPFAFDPDTALHEVAKVRGWPIVNQHTILDAVGRVLLTGTGHDD
jgi:HAD superfamily phosphoserine phosphatase-like hydrolase